MQLSPNNRRQQRQPHQLAFLQLATHLSLCGVVWPRAGQVALSTVRRGREREGAPAAPAGDRPALVAGTRFVAQLSLSLSHTHTHSLSRARLPEGKALGASSHCRASELTARHPRSILEIRTIPAAEQCFVWCAERRDAAERLYVGQVSTSASEALPASRSRGALQAAVCSPLADCVQNPYLLRSLVRIRFREPQLTFLRMKHL